MRAADAGVRKAPMKHAAHIALSALLAAAAPDHGTLRQPHSAQPEPDTASADLPTDVARGSAIASSVADDRLVPSEASGDDCSAGAGIEILPDEPMRRLHARLCEAAVQPAYRARCDELAASLQSIQFVTDHCAGPEEPLEVSLGGRTYRLLRTGAAADHGTPALAGNFAGDGLRMHVRPGRVIREHLDEGERIGIEQEVVVTLTLDGATRTLPAVYSDGP
jgi:hypothetical protein